MTLSTIATEYTSLSTPHAAEVAAIVQRRMARGVSVWDAVAAAVWQVIDDRDEREGIVDDLLFGMEVNGHI